MRQTLTLAAVLTALAQPLAAQNPEQVPGRYYFENATDPGTLYAWLNDREGPTAYSWMHGTDEPSLYHWLNETSAGSQYYWRNETGPGSEYYWTNSSERGFNRYHWTYGSGPFSRYGWEYQPGTRLPTSIVSICLSGVLDVAPCALLQEIALQHQTLGEAYRVRQTCLAEEFARVSPPEGMGIAPIIPMRQFRLDDPCN